MHTHTHTHSHPLQKSVDYAVDNETRNIGVSNVCDQPIEGYSVMADGLCVSFLFLL